MGGGGNLANIEILSTAVLVRFEIDLPAISATVGEQFA